MFISERHRRRRGPWLAALAVLIVAGAALAAYLILGNRTDDVRRGDEVEFRAPPPKRPKADDTVDWPVYHYDLAHTGYLPARVRPPFKERWVFTGKVLMEFPPIVVDGSVYFMRNNGGTYRLDADTGKVKWKNQIGNLSATSPAYWDEKLFVTSLSGKITALRAKDGKVLWQKQVGSRTESSPIVRRGVVYFGTEG
jgi:outer membrane protein assembly factor BamB